MDKTIKKSRNSDIGVLASFNGIGNIKPFRICLDGKEYNVIEILEKKDNNYAACQSISFFCRLETDEIKEIIYFISTHSWKCRNVEPS